MYKGCFITFEGTDASGKSTQIDMLRDYLDEKKIPTLWVREPGGTDIGEKIREIILDKSSKLMTPITEALLYAAARAQLVEQVIRPALESGKLVISDRFLDSSIAYQKYARGLGDMVDSINAPAVSDIKPDLTIFLRVSPEVMRERRSAEEEDRMDAQTLEFHERVLKGYLQIASREPERFRTLDGSKSIEEIHLKIIDMIECILSRRQESTLLGE